MKFRSKEAAWNAVVADPNQSNADNLNNVRREASRHFRNKKKNILKLELINFKLTVWSKISQTCTGELMNLRKVTSAEYSRNEKGDLVTGSLTRWRSHFSQLLEWRGVSDVRQIEIHTAEPLMPESSDFGFEMAIEKFKKKATRYWSKCGRID